MLLKRQEKHLKVVDKKILMMYVRFKVNVLWLYTQHIPFIFFKILKVYCAGLSSSKKKYLHNTLLFLFWNSLFINGTVCMHKACHS